MKELIQISNVAFPQAKTFGSLYYRGENISDDKDYLVFFEGFIIDESFNSANILSLFKSKGLEFFNQLEGSYNIIVVDKIKNKVYITNDSMSIRSIYYYCSGAKFVVSNRFWNSVDILNPDKDMLDLEAICRYGVYNSYLYHNTPIKGLKSVLAGSNFILDFSTFSFTESKYYKFQDFVEDKRLSLETSAHQFNEALKKFSSYIKRITTTKKIGLSISGGLDSRILPGLFGKEPTYFVIVGKRNISKLGLKPYNYYYIDKIAKAFGINIMKLDQSLTPVEEKIDIEMKNFPIGGENFIKTINPKRYGLNFDYLVTAGHPDLLSGVRAMSAEGIDLLDIMENYEGNRYLKRGVKSGKVHKLVKLYHLIKAGKNTIQIPLPTDVQDFYPIRIFEKDQFYKATHSYIKNDLFKDDDSNSILKYRYDNGSDICCGAFESLTGQVKETYSMFYPFGNDVLKHVPFKYIKDRLVLKQTIHDYYKNVYNIESEHSLCGIHDEEKTSWLKIIKAIISQRLRGVSHFADMLPEQKESFLSFYDKESLWFNEIFDNDLIRNLINQHSYVFMAYLKLKLVIGTIERKEWKKYCV